MFFGKIDNPIGLDISELSVKFTQLEPNGSFLKLSAFADVDLPEGLVSNDMVANEWGMVDFLKDIFTNPTHHNGRIVGRSIVASIPESKAYVRVINLPPLLPDELITAVPLEAEQYIPLPLDQMELDWQLVSSSNENSRVLITATPKDYVGKLVEIMRRASLIPQALEVESAAIVRSVLPKDSTSPIPGTLILDMDAARTSLIVFAENSVQFTSSIPMAGNAITDAIVQRLQVAKEEAEHIKRLHGIPLLDQTRQRLAPEVAKLMSEITVALDPVLNNLYDEVKNTIKFHEEHSDTELSDLSLIRQVLLCGGTSKLPNIVDYLQGKISSDESFSRREIKVSQADPWHNIVGSGLPPFSRHEALSYTTSLGLALRNYT